MEQPKDDPQWSWIRIDRESKKHLEEIAALHKRTVGPQVEYLIQQEYADTEAARGLAKQAALVEKGGGE